MPQRHVVRGRDSIMFSNRITSKLFRKIADNHSMTIIKCGPIDRAIAEAIEQNDSPDNFFRKSGKGYQIVVDITDQRGHLPFLHFSDNMRKIGSGLFSPAWAACLSEVGKIEEGLRKDIIQIEVPLSDQKRGELGSFDQGNPPLLSPTGATHQIGEKPLHVMRFQIDLSLYFDAAPNPYRERIDQFLRSVRWFYDEELTRKNTTVGALPVEVANFVEFLPFPDIHLEAAFSPDRLAVLRGFDPAERFLKRSARPDEASTGRIHTRLALDLFALTSDAEYRTAFREFAAKTVAHFDELLKPFNGDKSGLPIYFRNFYFLLRAFANHEPPLVSLPRLSDVRALFQDYLVAHYGGTDELSCNAFLREEMSPAQSQSSFELRQVFLGRRDRETQEYHFDLWLQKAPSALKGLTLDDLLAVLSAAGPAGTSTQRSTGSMTQSETTTAVIHVGDGQATVGENTAGTARFARTLEPIGEESVVLYPTQANLPREITLEFESVNWTTASDLGAVKGDPKTFIRPCAVHVIPSNYNGPIPASDSDQREWRSRNWHEGIDDPVPYFTTLYPRRMGSTGSETLRVRLPQSKLPFKVVVQAGARSADADHLYRLHSADPYDNFDVKLIATNLRLAPGVSESKANTLVLGDEFPRVTRREEGRVIPLDYVSPGTANSSDSHFPRLSSQTYALYHPMATDPKADFWRAHRTFAVERGKKYLFQPVISGIDGWSFHGITSGPVTAFQDPDSRRDLLSRGAYIRIENGEDETYIFFTESSVLYLDRQGQLLLEDKFSRWGSNSYERWLVSPTAAIWSYERSVAVNDGEITIEVREPDDTWTNVKRRYWRKIVVDSGSHGRWYVSTWRKDEGFSRFRLVERKEMADEYEARQEIEAYNGGTIKKPWIEILAKTDRVRIFVQTHNKADLYQDAAQSLRSPYDADEIRVDNLGLVPLD